MAQLQKIAAGLNLKQRITIGAAGLFTIAGVYGIVRWTHDRDFKTVYTDVAPGDAASIVQKLKESGVEYKLSDSGAIMVPSASVAEMRLQLAAALPKTGRIGFELFDKANFSETEFVQHVNYARALEGELERSVSSLSSIQESRVHITLGKDSVFTEARQPAKASVIVKLRPAGNLTTWNVNAIQQLVASAVEGLNPGEVAVVDSLGSLLSRRAQSPEDEASDAAYSRRRQIEHDLLESINLTLDPLLGHEKYRAGISVDCDLTSGEQSEETFQPDKSVMTSSQKTEEVTNAATGSAGIPGTASNLPRPAARVGAGNATSKRTENISYQSGHLVRKTLIPGGVIRRISVAVLLDQHVRWEGRGPSARAIFNPPSAETIQAVRDVVVGVTGFTQDRGDQITVETVPFESTLNQRPPETQSPPRSSGPAPQSDWAHLIQNPMVEIAGGAALLLVAVLLIAVFVLARKKGRSRPAEPMQARTLDSGAAKPADTATVMEQMQAALAQRQAEQEQHDVATLAALKLPTITTKKSDLLVKELRETTKKEPSVPAHVLQGWLHERE